MSTFSSRLGLYLPAGNENVSRVNDIINNFEKLEDLVGLTLATSSVAPSSPFQGQFRLNTDNHRSYIYDRSTWQEFPTASERCGTTIGWGTAGDANNKIQLTAGGRLEMGAGGASTVDVNLYRSAANVLKTDDQLAVAGGTAGIVDTYTAAASGALTTSTTDTDVPGASVTVVTARANAVAIIHGVYDITCSAFTTAGVGVGMCMVDGVLQTAQALFQPSVAGQRATVTQQWVVNLGASGSKVVKLQGRKTGGTNTITINANYTTLGVLVLNAGV